MPSPFPVMDPFIEMREWEDFHASLNGVIKEMPVPRIRPKYTARVQLRVLPMPEERRESYLVIREIESMEIVTVIETLSPSNKRASGDGRRQYLEKREEVLQSKSHLVELDLLRGGTRLATIGPLPRGDYYAIVSRRTRRPRAQAYAWTLRDQVPPVPIPLKGPDPDVMLDLSAAIATVYDRASYDLTLDYRQPLVPPLGDADVAWADELIRSRREVVR